MPTKTTQDFENAVETVERTCDRWTRQINERDTAVFCEARGHSITVFQTLPPFSDQLSLPTWMRRAPEPMKLAQLRFDAATGDWTLFWANRSDRWMRYDEAPDKRLRNRHVEALLEEIHRDPYGCFWV
jgi:hypothetical protein